ncbi:hypothetical protein HPY32_16400 [Nocardia terpenica]|nr:hypothetical protein [Nocardia terpenica]
MRLPAATSAPAAVVGVVEPAVLAAATPTARADHDHINEIRCRLQLDKPAEIQGLICAVDGLDHAVDGFLQIVYPGFVIAEGGGVSVHGSRDPADESFEPADRGTDYGFDQVVDRGKSPGQESLFCRAPLSEDRAEQGVAYGVYLGVGGVAVVESSTGYRLPPMLAPVFARPRARTGIRARSGP